MKALLAELSRRNVFRVAAAYVVVGWIVLQVVGLLAPSLGLPPWTVALNFIILVATFPIALILAWAFELTPKGVERTQPLEGDVDHTIEVIDFALAAGTGVLIALTAFWIVTAPDRGEDLQVASSDIVGAPTDTRVSVAVLPFVNMSADADQEYFSDGITEEILNSLAALEDLRVTSRTSSFSFKGKQVELPDIAAALDVGHILEGSVRKSGDKIRITAQLIRASDDAHLWSQTYDRELTEVFQIQEEISDAIAGTLEVRLLGRPAKQVRKVNPEAYDHYLKGQSYLQVLGFAEIEKALDEFRQARALDPTLSDALMGEARALAFSVATGKEPPMPTLALAEHAAYKALDFEPDSARAQAALALVEVSRRDLFACLDRYKRAEAGGGMDGIDYWFYADALSYAGRFEEAEAMLQRNLKRDPLSGPIHFALGLNLAMLARTEEAIPFFETAIELEPDNPAFTAWYSVILSSQTGDMAKALEVILRSFEQDPADAEIAAFASLFYFTIEDYESAEIWISRAEALDPESPAIRYFRARYHGATGDMAAAIEIAEEMLASGSQMRHGALRGALSLVREAGLNQDDLEALYFERSRPLALFGETDSLFSYAQTTVPAAFLGVDLAAILAEAGRHDESERLTTWVLKNLGPRQYPNFPGSQLVRAEAMSIEGRDDEALAAIGDIVANELITGWQWRLRDNPHFDRLKERPEFIAILEKVKRRNEETRASLSKEQ